MRISREEGKGKGKLKKEDDDDGRYMYGKLK